MLTTANTQFEKFNTREYYNGKLLELRQLIAWQLEFKEAKEDLQLNTKDFMGDIPSMFTHLEIFGDRLAKYKEHMEETPNWTTYLYLYPDQEIVPWYLNGIPIFHSPMYAGKGTINRIISHSILGKNASKAEIKLNSYITGFRQVQIEPILLIIGKELDETRAKWLEADLIKYIQAGKHYITSNQEGLRTGPAFLNYRDEITNEGYMIKTDGMFGRTRPPKPPKVDERTTII